MATVYAVPRAVPASEAMRSPASISRASARPGPAATAPHVRAQLEAVCCGDAVTTAQIAAALTPAQRAGLSALPDPLPLVPAIRDVHGATERASDRRILLTAAVCVDDRVEILLEACGISMVQLMTAAAVSALSLVAGRFWYADPRMRILVHESASLAERTAAHRALGQVYRRRDEADRALWHRALSTMEGDGRLANPLLALASAQLEAGQADRAHATAREAASHAGPDDVDAARELAGRAALSAGWLDDAIAWLTPVVTSPHAAADAVSAFSIATMLRHGAPWTPIAPADSIAFDVLTGRWAGLTASDIDATSHNAPIWRALRAALHDDDVDAALEILSVASSPHVESGFLGACAIAPGPLLRAHREVLTALLRTWRGDLAEARRALQRAASAVPLALPFSGLATRLAKRLELAVDGRAGELSSALEGVSPLSHAQDRPLERAIAAYLCGRSDEATVHLSSWNARRQLDVEIDLPALDEVGAIEPRPLVQTPDAARAGELRRRIRAAGACSGVDLTDAETAAAQITSPFERGRTEALLGIAAATRGDRAGATRHLRASIGMLADAGADAWRCAVEGRLMRLGEPSIVDVRTPTTPIAARTGDPLAVCRSAWQPLLTARELEIAMLIAGGASNRSIAEGLHLSVRTIEVNAGRIFRKFGVRSRGELTVLAHRTNQHA